MSLGKKIHELRVKANFTQKDLSEKLHVTSQAVSRWEQDIVEPSIGTIVEMAKIFGVSVDELVGAKSNGESTIVEEEHNEVVASETNKETITKEDISNIIKEEINNKKGQIGVCDRCHTPIYEGESMFKKT